MTRAQEYTTRLTCLADLGAVFGIETGEDSDTPMTVPPVEMVAVSREEVVPGNGVDDAAPDLTALLADLDTAVTTLAAIARQDGAVRETALEGLTRYDTLVAAQRDAEAAHERAQQVRRDAETVVAGAFTDEARAAATDITRLAMRAERAAAHAIEEQRRAVEYAAAQPNVARLLAERRRQEEEAAAKARAAAAERAGRLAAAIASIQKSIDAGRFEEARVLLGAATNEFPDNAEIASLQTMIARREFAVKTLAAEEALWAARREHRRQPAEAVARLEALDVEGLPQPLASQIFGEWARACARLCRERGIDAPLRYAPHQGRGAVLAPTSTGDSYTVVSALGMEARWRPGSLIPACQARGARPLRTR